jgi:hypothetical protein
MRGVILSFAFFLTLPLFAREKTDVIVMKNGDRFTGEVKGLNAGVLSVDLDYVDGSISVQWSQVARLESSQLFVVNMQDGTVYAGTITTAEAAANQPMKMNIAGAEEKTVAIETKRIAKMSETSQQFWKRFNGGINFGINYSKGNQATQYSFGTQAEYLRERWAAQSSFNSNLSSNSGSATSTRNQFGFSGYHLLSRDKYYYGGMGNLLQSAVQNINLQTTLGGGIGRFLKNTNRMTITLLGGLAWQGTEYHQSLALPQGSQNIVAGLIAAQWRVFKFKKTNLDASATLIPALSEPGRVFYSTNVSYYLKLFSNLNWNVSVYGNWDNRPPPTFSGSDYGSTSGLSWTFGK